MSNLEAGTTWPSFWHISFTIDAPEPTLFRMIQLGLLRSVRHRSSVVVGLLSFAMAAPELRAEWLHYGACELEVDPVVASAGQAFTTCIRARTSAEMAVGINEPKDNQWVMAARANATLNLGPYAAVFVEGHAVRQRFFDGESLDKTDRRLDALALQLGNPALHRVRLVGGVVRQPFGIDSSYLMEFFRAMEGRGWWRSPDFGAVVTLDNMSSSSIDVGIGRNRSRRSSESEPMTDDSRDHLRAYAFRLMHDIAPLDGSRLVASALTQSDGQRRFGLGFINANAKGDETHLEWLRVMATPDGRQSDFEQIVRIAYRSEFRANNRMVAHYDDERLRYRLGVIGVDFAARNWFLIRTAVAYRKSESPEISTRWFLVTGLEAGL